MDYFYYGLIVVIYISLLTLFYLIGAKAQEARKIKEDTDIIYKKEPYEMKADKDKEIKNQMKKDGII